MNTISYHIDAVDSIRCRTQEANESKSILSNQIFPTTFFDKNKILNMGLTRYLALAFKNEKREIAASTIC